MAKIFRKSNLEADEIFFDAQVLKEGDSKLEQPLWGKTFLLFSFLSLLFFIILISRSVQLSLLDNSYYASLADFNYKRFQYELAPRGVIYDRFGEQLVFNEPSLDLVLIPAQFPLDSAEQEKIFTALAEITEFDPPPFNALKGGGSILLKENLSLDAALLFENKKELFPGIKIEKGSRRQYKDGPIFAHVIGYTGKPNPEEILGKDGLEAFYNDVLRGKNRKREIEIDALGNVRKDILVSEFQKGEDLHLTIDANLQRKLFQSLKSNLTGEGGAAIALDPRNGEVLALASLPSFDNNLLILKDKSLKTLFSDPLHPFFNRAISGTYPSGSTIKPIIGAAALEEKIINENTKLLDSGTIYVHNQFDPNIVYTYSSYAPLGLLDIRQALALSSNVFFYILGGGLPDETLSFAPLGIERISKYLHLFGFGERAGIDLNGEAKGFIPLPVWKETVQKQKWLLGDTYNVSIGQGDFTTTPLQVGSAFSAIINGGTIFKPHLLKDKPAQILRTNFLDKKNLSAIKSGLRDSVRYGTSQGLNTLLVSAGGKTGTAQRSEDNNDNYAWFVGFAPFDNPEILLIVLVESGRGGATNALPVAKEALNWYFSR